MTDRRWMPMSERYFASKTWGMRVEEVGAMCLIWASLAYQPHGRLRLDEQSLATTARLSVRRWRKIAPKVMAFFVVDGDFVSLPPKKQGYRSAVPHPVKRFVFGRDGNKCRYCGTTSGSFEIDHVVAVIRGGSNDPDNLCVACSTCNRSKNALTLEEWVN